ncbi:helix-turn-helix domain-containing protein [Erysipelothrix rhusiopathiae]|nr:helix-turn-helix domain-containing protein [Erysipelothrix rhusiopathiae]
MRPSIYGSRLKPSEYAIYLYLWDRSGWKKSCFPSVKTIAADLGISVSTVRRGIRTLEKNGYIRKEARFRENNGNSSNLYTLIEKDATRE